MRRGLLVFVRAGVAAAVLAGAAQAQGAPVPLSAGARMVLRADLNRASLTAAAESLGRFAPQAAAFALSRGPGGETMVDVFVRCAPGTEETLRALGVRVTTRAGEWVTGHMPLSVLPAVARAEGVRGLEVARRARLVNDSSMLDIGVTGARTRVLRDHYQGATGRGVILGFVDTGIDFRHADFLEDDAGRSRILWLWDQTVDGTNPGVVGTTAFRYGNECTRDQLTRRGPCSERDVAGHGTHVAGIAASDGSGVQLGLQTFAYAGVATGAELIVVKSDLSFTSIVDGVNYIFARAAQLGRPAVINLSLGTQVGPHDGTEAPSVALDALTGPGRIVVAAAGNDGSNGNGGIFGSLPSIHGDTVVPVGGTATFTMVIPQYVPQASNGNDIVLLQSYHDPLDSFSITLQRPNGSTVAMRAADTVATDLNAGGAVVIYHGSVAGDSVLADSNLMVGSFSPLSPSTTADFYLGEWVSGGAAPQPGLWTIRFTRVAGAGTGTLDIYASLQTLVQADVSFQQGARNRRLVGTPGDAHTVITVGAYSTRASWRSVDGLTYGPSVFDSVATGDLLLFSAPGPTRDGRLKPEITAPGRVFSTLSADAAFPVELIASDSAHALLEGTSMSSPHVAGAVALLLARRPTQGPAEILAALTGAARTDARTAVSYAGDAGVPNNSWGYGKLSVPGALALVTPTAGRAVVASANADAATVDSRRGMLVPLQRLRIGAMDAESLSVTRIGAVVTGRDAAFRLGLVPDRDGDGAIGPGETPVGLSAPTALDGTANVSMILPADSALVPRGGTADFILAGVLSGAVPNATAFSGTVVPDSSATSGMRSGLTLTFNGLIAPAASVSTTLLAAGERLNLSQNPVRTSPLVINFATTARRIAVYDFAGRLVVSFTPLASDRDLQWDLRRADGERIADGAYVVVADLAGGTVRRKIFVAR